MKIIPTLKRCGFRMLLAGYVGVVCLGPSGCAEDSLVPVKFEMVTDYQGPQGQTVTGFIVAAIAGATLQESMAVSAYVSVHSVGTAVARMVVDKAYPYSFSHAWTYDRGLLTFTDLGCYTLEFVDSLGNTQLVSGAAPSIVLNGTSSKSGTVYLRNAGTVWFGESCACSVDPVGPELRADGQSTISAAVPGMTIANWGFKNGISLGCRITGTPTSSTAIIQAGRVEGDVVIVATRTDGCRYEGTLALVCSDEESGCGSETCNDWGSGTVGTGFLAIQFQIALGLHGSQKHGGFLWLRESVPSPALSTPASLRVKHPSPEFQWIWNQQGGISQVKTPLGLVNVVVDSPLQYHIRFYAASAVGGLLYGRYQLQAGATPFVTWTVRNPDPSGLSYHQLEVVETRGTETRASTFTYDSVLGKWTLTSALPGATVSTWKVDSGSTRYEYRQVAQGATIVRLERRKYEPLAGREVLKEIRLGSDSVNTTTTYTYYDASAPAKDRYELKQVDHPDGSWEIFEYDTSTSRRPEKIYSAWGDQAPTTNRALCRLTTYAYSLSLGTDGVEDNGAFQPASARKTVVTVPGGGVAREVARAYHKRVPDAAGRWPQESVQQDCLTANVLWGAADNLLTVTKYYPSGTFAGQPKCVNHPDGTRTVYLYNRSGSGTGATETTAVLVGQPDGANDTNILAGTVTTTVVGHIGQLVSRQSRDKASATVLSQETYSYADELIRSHTVTYLDGSSQTVQYACCGLDTVTDRNKVLHQYLYDPAGRLLGATDITHALTLTNVLDAAGNVRVSVRNAAGDLIPLDRRAYSTAGQITLQTNASGGVTAYTETTNGQGQKVRTTTYPDGGTRVETYFKDGQLAKVTGTATQPSRYEYSAEIDDGIWREYTKEIKLDANGDDTGE